MKIAVTGASGYLGRHVLQVLSKTPDVEVVALSRRPAGDWLPPGMRHAAIDLATPGEDTYERIGKPDAVLHLAWDGLPNYQSRHHFESQLGLQYRFLASLAQSGMPSLTCAGTCFEYGAKVGELEEGAGTDPGNPYAYAKDALRRQLEFLFAETGCKLTWARLFYSYGAGQPISTLYGQFVAAGARGDRVFRMSGGEQLRDYLPAEEVARLLVALVRQAPGAGAVNVCSGQPVSVRALVERWLAAHAWQMELALGALPYPPHEPMAFWGSTRKLKALLPAT